MYPTIAPALCSLVLAVQKLREVAAPKIESIEAKLNRIRELQAFERETGQLQSQLQSALVECIEQPDHGNDDDTMVNGDAEETEDPSRDEHEESHEEERHEEESATPGAVDHAAADGEGGAPA